MKKALVTLSILGLSQMAFAGVGGTTIKCASASGKTKVEATTEDGGGAMIRFSVKDASGRDVSLTYINKSTAANVELNGHKINDIFPGAKVAPIVSIAQSVAVALVVVESVSSDYDHNPISLVSKPGSVKLTRDQYSGERGTFKAYLHGIDPRKNSTHSHQYLESQIEVSCTYDYSI